MAKINRLGLNQQDYNPLIIEFVLKERGHRRPISQFLEVFSCLSSASLKYFLKFNLKFEREVGVKPKIAFTVTSLSSTIFAGHQNYFQNTKRQIQVQCSVILFYLFILFALKSCTRLQFKNSCLILFTWRGWVFCARPK